MAACCEGGMCPSRLNTSRAILPMLHIICAVYYTCHACIVDCTDDMQHGQHCCKVSLGCRCMHSQGMLHACFINAWRFYIQGCKSLRTAIHVHQGIAKRHRPEVVKQAAAVVIVAAAVVVAAAAHTIAPALYFERSELIGLGTWLKTSSMSRSP